MLSTGAVRYFGVKLDSLYESGSGRVSVAEVTIRELWILSGILRACLEAELALEREVRAGAWQLFFVWIAGILGLGIPSVWVADGFYKGLFDRPVVDFARWLGGRWVEKEQ